MYLDIDGNEFTEDAWLWVNNLIKDIDSRQGRNNSDIARLKAKIASGKAGEEEIKRLTNRIAGLSANNTELEGVRGEINTLSASNQVYDVAETNILSDSNSKVGALGFNFKNGKVYILMPSKGDMDLFSHELKHAYQFETGETGMVTKEENDKGVLFLGDRSDEVEGYERGKLFGQRETYTTNTLPDAYKDLPTGPINVNNHPEISRIMKLPPEQQKQALQNAANKGRAFRVNGKTYYKK